MFLMRSVKSKEDHSPEFPLRPSPAKGGIFASFQPACPGLDFTIDFDT
jgi:hypothetical protein